MTAAASWSVSLTSGGPYHRGGTVPYALRRPGHQHLRRQQDTALPNVTGALVYDTETAARAMGPAPPENTCCFFVAVSRGETKDEKLYTLGKTYHRDRSEHPRGHLVGVSVHALSWARSPAALAEPWLPSHEWVWESVAAPTAPFDGNEETVVSYAVHPDGHTIFFSTKNRSGDPPAPIPSTRSGGSGGRTGNGCCLSSGGLLERRSTHGSGSTRTATSAAAGPPRPRREQRRSGGRRSRSCSARGTTLTHTHMGNNVFCLVESVVREDVDPGAPMAAAGCALHVTVFGLKYNREGEVQATSVVSPNHTRFQVHPGLHS
ncbi:hypothetical protein ZWY2020_008387 [Hordeum vulgare]|nr:hypothetical protein ZWY2020_008387 [Hordeum vulgare]